MHILCKAARHVGRIAGDAVAGAENAQVVLAFLMTAGAASVAGVVGHGRCQFADLPAGRAGFDNLTGELMTQHRAGRHDEGAMLGRMKVGAADAAIVDSQDQAAGLACRLRDVMNFQRFSDTVEDGSTHGVAPY